MQAFINKIEQLTAWVGKTVALLILPVILLTVIMVVKRYFFHIGTDVEYETSIFLYGIFFMLSGAFCLQVKGHVSVDILARIVPAKGKYVLDIISSLAIFAFSFLLTWQGTKMAWQSTLIREHSIHQTAFNPEIWWFKWAVPLAALLMLLQTLADLLKTIQIMKKGGQNSGS